MRSTPKRGRRVRTAQVEVAVGLADLKPDPNNRRKRTARNLAMITDALRTVGAARSIVIDEHNEVLAGNGVVEGAAAAGITKLQIVDVDGDTLVTVRRRGLTDVQKRDLAMFDNRAGELAEWDASQIAADLAAGESLAPFFFDKELDALFKTKTPTAGGTDAVLGADLEYRIVVECTSEHEQAALLQRLESEGLTCRALIS